MSLLLLLAGGQVSGPPPVPQLPRIVTLKTRSTVRIATESTIRISGRSTLSLAQPSTIQIPGRSTLKLPKE